MGKYRQYYVSVKDDIVLNIIFAKCAPEGYIKIDPPPKGVPYDFLRYYDGRLINIAELSEFHVDKKGQLHCVEVPGSIPIKMKFSDRKHLVKKNGKYVLLSKNKQRKLKQQKKIDIIRRKRQKKYPSIGDQLDAILKFLKDQPGLSSELTDIIDTWGQVKEDIPKP